MKKTARKKTAKKLRIVPVCLASLLIAAVLFCWLITEPAINISGFQQLTPAKLNQIQNTLSVYDSDGQTIGGDFIMDNKIYTPIASLPAYTADAFVSIEDTRFFQHGGIDYYRIAGAAAKNVKSQSFKEGASTITQQLVKNTHLSGEKKIRRKINEMRIAIDLERRYSKNEILEMYLNVIYFGNNVYGIGAAAKAYFNKPAEKLTLNESALLAAVINNPAKFNPVTNPDEANRRRRLVLSQMKKFGRLSEDEYNQTVQEDIFIDEVFFDQYANFLIAEACETLAIDKSEFFSRGYQITTYLDKSLQQNINGILRDFCLSDNKSGGTNNKATANNNVNNTSNNINNKNKNSFSFKNDAFLNVMVMTAQGDIIANAGTGGRDLSGIYRQPGSLIKPAISYAPALEKKLIVPVTPILDEPLEFDGYSPKNNKNKSLGWISVCESLKLSQNIPAIKLTDMCGIEYCKNIASRLGYSFEEGDDHLALALGGMEKGAKLTQIINSYQAFANGGRFIKGAHISAIRDGDGNAIYNREHSTRQAVSPETAYFINEMLSECATDGTAKRIGSGYAAKTGTVGTQEGNSDAYAVAYNGSFVVAVWIGAKNGLLPNTVNGATYPCIIAKQVLELLPQDGGFNKPNSITSVELDKTEYFKNHKLLTASPDTPKKDRLAASFSIYNMPYNMQGTKTLDNNFILKTDDIELDNFIIVNKNVFLADSHKK